MTNYICTLCGVQYAESEHPPAACPVCEDERQYLRPEGQGWTTLDEMTRSYRNEVRLLEPGISGIGTAPKFAIGQRAMLIQTSDGNILWDCITLIDDESAALVERLGGIAAIAISHPHYYSSMVEWSRRFGDAPIYLHEDDRRWVMRPDRRILLWSGERLTIADGATLIRCGGHFAGSSVLHWARGADGKGTLHTGDTIYVAADRRSVSFMYSYPNYLPLPAWQVRRIANTVRPYRFARVYGAWWDSVADGEGIVERSARRYVDRIES